MKRLLVSVALAAALAVPAAQANTINISNDNSSPANIPGLTGFVTTGAMMSGLQVTACFTILGCQTRSWATTGAVSGGVTGDGWALSVDGDTFTANIWNFVMDNGAPAGQITSLLLDGRDAFTIFDRTEPDQGTPDSARGRDFLTDVGDIIDVTYMNPTSVGANAAVGDLFQQVFIQFRDAVGGGATGPRISFNFSQDTDNDSRFGQVPEPGSLALLAIAALGLGLTRRRR